MGNILVTSETIRDLVSRRGIKVFDHGLIPNHTAVGSIVGTTSVSGQFGLKVLYTLDALTLNNVPAMSGIIQFTSFPPNNTLNPGITYINWGAMADNYRRRFANSGTPAWETGLQGMTYDPRHAPTGVSGGLQPSSGVVNVVAEYSLVVSGYARIQVDYYPDDVAYVSGLFPVSRLRVL